jgi:hypothetical protein
MCNNEFSDSLRELVGTILSHCNDLGLKFNHAQKQFREGNLDETSLSELNHAIHLIEADSAKLERLIETE